MAASELRIEYTSISMLLPAERNPKLHDEAGIRASIERFGFAEPVTINESTGRLVAGHGRLIVLNKLKAEGAKAPARIQVKGKDWLVPTVRGLSFINDAAADAYLLGSNQLTIAGGWDEGLLLSTIADLAKASADFAGTGFGQGDIDKALAAYGNVAAEAWAAPVAPVAAPVVAPVAAVGGVAPVAAVGGVAPAAAPAAAAPIHVAIDDGALGMGFGEAEEDHGILDPINRELTKGENAGMGEAVRFMRYAIPLTVEESGALETAIEDWVHKTGGMFGFIRDLLKAAGRI